MFEPLKNLFDLGQKPEKIDRLPLTVEYLINDLFASSEKSHRYFRALGASGRAVSVFTGGPQSDNLLTIKFERKIEPSDVKDGSLVPIAVHEIKQRGGKRSVSLTLRQESAEALHAALGKALRDTRRQQFISNILQRTFEMMYAGRESIS